MPDYEFAGIPVYIDPWLPPNEAWIVQQGKKITFRVHEGPRGGETVAEWMRRPTITRIINLGDK